MTTSGRDTGLDLGAVRRELAGAQDGGRLLPLGLGRVVTGAGAVGGLADVTAGLAGPRSEVVVLAAATPMTAGGRDLRTVVEDALAGRFAVRWVVIGPPDGLVHADETTVAAATAAAAGADCVVTVGSGTITDIGKAAAPRGTPLLAVQTATSVNGYADPFSVLLRRGVKRTTPSRWPDVLVIDPGVLRGAPPELNRAGAGDLMAMFTATADWHLASALMEPDRPASPGRPPPEAAARPPGARPGGARPGAAQPAVAPGDPPYHPAAAGLALARGQRLLALAPGLGGAAPGADRLAELAGILTLSGIAMGVAGTTAPSSGMEHAISHLLEMAATARGQRGNFHGAQVGVASIVAARTWAHVRQRVAERGLDRAVSLPDPDAVRNRIGRAFAAIDPTGAMAGECFSDYARKLRRLDSWASLTAAVRSAWQARRDVLDRVLIEPATLAGALRAAGLPDRFGGLAEPVDEDTARWAVANCALMRQRFCVADLAMLLGAWEEADVEEVLGGGAAPRAAPAAPR